MYLHYLNDEEGKVIKKLLSSVRPDNGMTRLLLGVTDWEIHLPVYLHYPNDEEVNLYYLTEG